MSRCFPYPPPGFSLGKVGNEALVESIKLQMETERVAKELRKKEKRKEKKEKRKEKKDKTKAYTEKNWEAPKSGCFPKVIEAEAEHLEKSSVTEEHEKPIYLCLPSSPSDSTGNSNKRKRHSSPLVGSHDRGNIIRIRLLPPKKPKEQDNEIAGRTNFPAEHNNEIAIVSSQEKNFSTENNNSIVGAFPIGTIKEPVCSTSGRDEAAATTHGKARTASGHDTAMTNMQKVELKYKSLFENWDPPQLLAQDIGQDDEEWLFRGRNQDVHVGRKIKLFSDPISCSSTSALGPRAQYLQEADVYALPYTVPF
ncbi:unnamed protein product [Fraxinus pennsylvanica]|uniref:Uncharacterized protein n=1 Tax=Fraxinus pennsylvanica TaxID=56036 RepID=A0AAD2AE66_9LAMI|nr:unnamed protein product [Fraxinus pennsylvanica]